MHLGQYLRMLLLSCFSLTLCVPMDCSPLGSSVHEILQSRILEWVAIPFSRASSRPRDQTCVSMSPGLAGSFFTTGTTGKALYCNSLLQKVYY